MKVVLTTCNAKYIHKNLALRWLYVACPFPDKPVLLEFTIKDEIEHIVERLLLEQADLICFSCYIWNIEPTLQIIKAIKKRQPNVKILCGGPEVSFESEDLLNQGVDALSIGEGEQSVWEYATMLMNEEDKEIEGIMTLTYPNKSYRYVDLKWNETLDDPYFLEFDLDELDKRYFYFETSRGCPYGCEYCLSSTDNKVRLFSEEYIFKILKKIAHSKIKQVKFLDRTFNVKPQRALRIARYINEHCVNQIFQFEIVAETLSEELLEFFTKEADVSRFRFEIGVQSFNCNTLKAVGRIQNNERLKSVIARLRAADCVMHVDLIAGLPYEGFDSFRDSFNELFSLQASELQLGTLKLLKGTSLKRKKELYGLVSQKQAPYEVKWTNWLNEAEMERIHQCATAVEKFYNSGRCRKSIHTILELMPECNAFDLFCMLGERLKRCKNYHIHDLFLILKECTALDEEIIEAILMSEYMGLFKQKPKRIFKSRLSKQERNEILSCLSERYTMNELIHYAVVEPYYDKEVMLQVVVYNSQQTYPKRYKIKNQQWEEIV